MYACRAIALLALAASAAGAGSEALQMHNQVSLAPAEGKIEFMDKDGFFGYAVTSTNKLLKVDLSDATDYMTSDSLSEYNSLYVVHEDDRYSAAERNSYTNNNQQTPSGFLYITAQNAGGDNVLLKVNKDTLNVMLEYTYAPGENIPYSIVSDEDYVYSGQNTNPAMIIKIAKGTMTKIGAATLDAGEADVRSMEFDQADTTHLYANTNTVPGRVVKIDVTSMSRVAAAVLTQGKNLLAGYVEDTTNVNFHSEFIFVGSNTAPAVISKIDKRTMTVDSEKELAHGQAITSMTADATNLYCGTYEKPGKLLVIRKSDLHEYAAIELTQDDVTSVVVSPGGHMMIGTENGMIAYNGLTVSQDCQIGDWGVWGECSTTCNTGFKTRQRVITQLAANGGAECTDKHLTEDHLCNNEEANKCALNQTHWEDKCKTSETGMTYQTGVTHKQKTCTDVRDGTEGVAIPAVDMCSCPEDKPVFNFGRCMNVTGCETAEQICSHTTCQFEAPVGSANGVDKRVIVHHHGMEQHGTKIRCRHTLGRMGTCKCFCHDIMSS
jgi:hypothetical protein